MKEPVDSDLRSTLPLDDRIMKLLSDGRRMDVVSIAKKLNIKKKNSSISYDITRVYNTLVALSEEDKISSFYEHGKIVWGIDEEDLKRPKSTYKNNVLTLDFKDHIELYEEYIMYLNSGKKKLC